MKPHHAAPLALLLAACAAPGPMPRPTPPISPDAGPPPAEVSAQRLAEHIRVLSSDEFLGRGPATQGEERTVAYIAEQFRLAGLEPGGPDGSWYQEVPLVMSDIVGTPRFTVTAAGRARTLTQGEEIAVVPTHWNVERVALADVPLVFLGYGVRAPERGWDDFAGTDLRGKIGVVLVNDPDFETGEGDFGGRAMTYYGRWTYKYEEAARQGLAGLLIVHETAPASYGWNVVANSFTATAFDIVRDDPSAVHPLLEAWIQRDLAVELFRAAGHDFEALKRRAQTRGFAPVPLEGVALSADYRVRRSEIRSRNVLGRLPGSTRPAETILYGAHWDHLGVGTPDARGDSIYNGAVDNATGTAAVLELARVFAAGPRPERTLVFAAWAVEEKGLLGSEYYAANPVYPLETTVAGFNIDAMEPHGPARDLLVVGSGQSELEDHLARHLAAAGRTATPDPNPEAGYFFRSDHFPLAKRGVPMLYVDSGEDLVEGGRAAGEAKAAAYRRDRYHQPADEYDAGWNLEGIAEDVALLHRMGLELANSRAWPNYRPTSEFRPIRDASAARRR
jgi:Zn-dependent M28 family amino/carboxypeptidase